MFVDGSTTEFDVQKLKEGGYDRIIEQIKGLFESGEIDAAKAWTLFSAKYKNLPIAEFKEKVLDRLDEFRPDTQESEWKPIPEAVGTTDELAEALNYIKTRCKELSGHPEENFGCYYKTNREFLMQLHTENLIYSPGLRIYTRTGIVSDSQIEHIGDLSYDRYNIGRQFYSELIQEIEDLVDETGRFDIGKLENGGYNVLIRLMREAEDQDLGGVAQMMRRRFYTKYASDPMLFKEEVLGLLD